MAYPSSFIQYPFSGIQSGLDIHPYHISSLYDELSGVQNTIGLNPLNGYSSLTSRITGVESTLTGVVTLVGSNIFKNFKIPFSGITGAFDRTGVVSPVASGLFNCYVVNTTTNTVETQSLPVILISSVSRFKADSIPHAYVSGGNIRVFYNAGYFGGNTSLDLIGAYY